MNRKDPAWAVLGDDFNDALFDMAREDDYVGIYREVSRLLGYGWQPIETRPIRDAVLIYRKGHYIRLACCLEDGTWWTWPDHQLEGRLYYEPTHWAPIPDQPK